MLEGLEESAGLSEGIAGAEVGLDLREENVHWNTEREREKGFGISEIQRLSAESARCLEMECVASSPSEMKMAKVSRMRSAHGERIGSLHLIPPHIR